MYNDPRAKDLLAQYPRQLAEGGAVDQPFQAPAVAPRGAPLPAAAANQSLAVAPRQRPVLAPVTPTLSMSQQFARDRAAQDAMIRDAIRNTGVTNPSTMDYRQLQRAVRAGDINAENIKQKFVDPELEARVRNAYAAIGRTGGVVPALEMPKQGGATADTYKQVRQDEFNYFADQLKQGKISPTDFQNAFLTKTATDIPATDLEAQRAYINNARKALGLADLEVPKPQNTGSYIGFGQYGGMGGMGGTQNQYNIGSIAGPKFTPTAPKLPTQPIDLSGSGSTPVQLFNAGGEAVADQTPRSMDLEQFLLENSRTQLGPVNVQEVRSARGPGKYDTRISKDEGGFQAFADVDVGDKKLSQLGARYAGRGRIGNYEVQYVFDPETKQPVITGAIRKELSPTSDVSAEGVYVPSRDGKDYYNAGIRYTKRFEDGGEVTADDIERVNKESYLSPKGVAPEMGEVKPKYPALNAWSKGLEMAAAPFDKYALDKRIPLVGGMTAADFMGMNDVASLARDVSYGDPVVRGKSLQTSKIDPRLLAVADIVPVAGAATKGATALAKAGAKEVARQVETGTGVIGRNTMDPRMYAAEFYSPAARAVESHKMDKMPASQWMAWLSSNAPKAAKEELAQTEAGRWLKEQEGNVSKQDLLAVINESSPEIQTRMMKEGDPKAQPRFSSFVLPEGVNQREMTLSLPFKEEVMPKGYSVSEMDYGKGDIKYFANTPNTRSKAFSTRAEAEAELQDSIVNLKDFRKKLSVFEVPDAHKYFDETADTNRVAHVRMNDRVDNEGRKVLFVEEIQSDWAQKGRKKGFTSNEYTDRKNMLENRVPTAPYVEDTKAWTGLALKKIIEDAVDNGYDSVAFTTGAQQNARYGLAKKVSEFRLSPAVGKNGRGFAKTPDGETIYVLGGYDLSSPGNPKSTYSEYLTENQIRKFLGDDRTDKLFSSKPAESPLIPAIRTKVLKDVDMEVGGEGMKGFYDQILPQSTKDVLKQLGVTPKIKQIDFSTKEPLLKRMFNADKTPPEKKVGVQWGFDITPELIAAVKEKGISKFKHGGEVTDFIKSKK